MRDLLLRRAPRDYDVATSAQPDEVERIFSKTVPIGRKFGVVMVIEGGCQVEVVTFRSEAGYRDGRRPTAVAFTDAKADAMRRDFTINGMFYDPVLEKVYDSTGGRHDLEARVIRAIGNPDERFTEDYLRMLRAVRFAAELGFEIESETFGSVRRNARLICGVSAERVHDEICKTFGVKHAARGLEILRESGLLELIMPEVAAMEGCEQSPEFHPEGDVYTHTKIMLELLQETSGLDTHPLLPWIVLLHDVAKPAVAGLDEKGIFRFPGHDKKGAEISEDILRRLRFSSKQAETITTSIRYHMQLKDVKKMRKSTLRRILLRPTIDLELELHRLDCLASHRGLDVYEFLVEEKMRLEKTPELGPPLISGVNLLEMGFRPGPLIGEILRRIRDKQLEGELTTSEAAVEWVKAQYACELNVKSGRD